MSDLTEYEETIEVLRASLGDVRYERPVPELPSRSTVLVRFGVAAVTMVVAGTVWSATQTSEPAWAESGSALTTDETESLTEVCEEAAQLTEVEGARGDRPALMAAESRGRTASLVFAGADHFVTCVAQDYQSGSEEGRVAVIARGEVADLQPASGPIRSSVLTISDPSRFPGDEEPPSANTFIVGKHGPNVDRVLIETSALGQFEATVDGDWFTAWWPTTESFEIAALDANGTEVARTSID